MSRYSERERAWVYMEWIHVLPCIVIKFGTGGIVDEMLAIARGYLRCSGPMQADHAGPRIAGMSTRSLDRDCIAMCEGHHRARTESKGMFSLMTKPQRVEWRQAAVVFTHALASSWGIEVPTC